MLVLGSMDEKDMAKMAIILAVSKVTTLVVL